MRPTAAFALALAACASTTPMTKLDERTPIVTAGPHCSSPGVACKCLAVDDYGHSAPANEGAVAAGLKRFEFRTGRGLDPVRITVEGRGTFEKNRADAEPTCAYVELPPGKHRVHLHAEAASAEAGMTPALFIRELGAKYQAWYDTFAFRCGGQDVCGLGDMQAWVDKVQAVPRGLHDPCGSVRVEGVRWDALRQSGVKLAELEIDLVLEVYKFAPRFPPGNHDCRGMDPQMKAEQEAAQK